MRKESKAREFAEDDKKPLSYPKSTKKGALVAEIATRFLELEELDRNTGIVLLRQLYGLSNASKPGFRLVCEILSGNPEAFDSSRKKAKRAKTSAQFIRQTQKKAVKRIEAENPEVAKLIEKFLSQNETCVIHN